MTTAARPTFDPAKGSDNKRPTFQWGSRDLPAHTKLKYRQPGQGTSDEIADRDLLKEELRRGEREHYEALEREKGGFVSTQRRVLPSGDDDTDDPEERRQRLLAEAEKLAALDKDDSDDDDSNSDDSSDEDDDDDDNDNTAELLAELEKIKKERAEEKERQERQRQEEADAAKEEQAMTGNPLLDLAEEKRDFSVKRRWDDDVIFKNQARGVDEKPKKRFINDTLRSDFHRRFLGKYIR
ncbi:Pre-mRNA-splicing factor Cwf15/Cwc15 [Umbelopsis sp. AD052]|nr:Pre-mRNA-splicing factor Cwf15/Cwc15 [Umbelopsis sp. AD052]